MMETHTPDNSLSPPDAHIDEESLNTLLSRHSHLNLKGAIDLKSAVLKAYGGYSDVLFGILRGRRSEIAIKRFRVRLKDDPLFAKVNVPFIFR